MIYIVNYRNEEDKICCIIGQLIAQTNFSYSFVSDCVPGEFVRYGLEIKKSAVIDMTPLIVGKQKYKVMH